MRPLPVAAPSTRRAFTLLELMTALVIIGILVVVLSPSITYLRARAQKVACIANLRSLHVATGNYIHDNHHWPQIALAPPGDPEHAKGWINALEPYGLGRNNWVCPAIQQALGSPDLSLPENARVDYYGTTFNSQEQSPFKYPKQPWFIETADMHGNGQEILFPDGHIEEAADIVRQGKATSGNH